MSKNINGDYWGCPHYGCGWMVPKDEKNKYEQHKRDAHMSESIDDIVTLVKHDPDNLMYYYDVDGAKYAITATDRDVRSGGTELEFKELLYDAHQRGDEVNGVYTMKFDYATDRFFVCGPYDDPNTQLWHHHKAEQQTGYEYECMMPNCTETMTTDSKHNMIRGDCDSCDKTTQFERVDQ